MRKSIASAAAAFVVLASTASAQVTYTGFDASRFTPTNALAADASFLSSLAIFGTETFSAATFARPQPMNYGVMGTGLITDPDPFSFARIDNLRGLLGQNGYGTAFGGTAAAPIVFTFSAPVVQGFGLFLSGLNDIGSGLPTVTLDFSLGGSNVFSWAVNDPNTNGDNTMFLGVSGIDFDKVELRGQNGDGVWFNDVTIGRTGTVATPEPSTFALFATGLFGVAFRVRRRSTKR